MLHGSFVLLNPAHLSSWRTLVQESGKLIQRRRWTDGIHLHTPVVFVLHPSAQAESFRVCLDKPAEAHPLNTPGHVPAARYGCSVRQCFDSVAPPASMMASTSDRSDLTVKGLVIRRKPRSTTYR